LMQLPMYNVYIINRKQGSAHVLLCANFDTPKITLCSTYANRERMFERNSFMTFIVERRALKVVGNEKGGGSGGWLVATVRRWFQTMPIDV
jgi:hypothetical protein